MGTYVGLPIRTQWLPDGRRVKLLSTISFIDSSKVVWTAKAGSIVDGASIPRPFWSLIGGPFAGKYKEASVLHDVHCARKIHPHKKVHKMFHEAMLTSGVSPTKARLMYWAVKWFGPKWRVK